MTQASDPGKAVREASAVEVKTLLDSDNPPILLDVREPEEVATAAIDGAIVIPMGEIPSRLFELQEHAESTVVTFCHGGIRSLNVANYLAAQGFEDVISMAGGIDAWSQHVDPTVPRY
ncbi:rhodanese-like domain-containing protein [Mucisphaera sp.]|uniref:rhodanese-like domain-containing protein n=1 Tax=Mucisphaera sp. TaxID=2913024 RepID=UPI003D126E59